MKLKDYIKHLQAIEEKYDGDLICVYYNYSKGVCFDSFEFPTPYHVEKREHCPHFINCKSDGEYGEEEQKEKINAVCIN